MNWTLIISHFAAFGMGVLVVGIIVLGSSRV